MTESKHYILDGHRAVPVDLITWAQWCETANRRVVETRLGDVRISTVFLGLDHSFGHGPPLLFETLVFGGPLEKKMERYTTWDAAEQGHARMVERVREEDE